jgi:hypothetical protein
MKNGRPNLFFAPNCDQSSKVVITLPRDVALAIELRRISVLSPNRSRLFRHASAARMMMDGALDNALTAEREDYFGRVALAAAFLSLDFRGCARVFQPRPRCWPKGVNASLRQQ